MAICFGAVRATLACGIGRATDSARAVAQALQLIRRRSGARAARRPARSRSAGVIGRAATTPQTGSARPRRVRERAMTWTCSCGTTLPSAATLSLSQAVTSLSARAARAISAISCACSSSSRSMSLDQRRPARHQDQPRIIGVVDQQHARQRQIADRNRVARELRVRATRRDRSWQISASSRHVGTSWDAQPLSDGRASPADDRRAAGSLAFPCRSGPI